MQPRQHLHDMDWSWIDDEDDITEDDNDDDDEDFNDDNEDDNYRVFFFHWASPKKLKYGKPRSGESTLT